MNILNFTDSAKYERKYIDETDAIGIWEDKGFQLISFPTPNVIPYMIKNYLQWNDEETILVIVNNQFFLDPLSKQESKDFINSCEDAYVLENVNMKGPGALSIRGLIYRKYPNPYKICRRMDRGGYVMSYYAICFFIS